MEELIEYLRKSIADEIFSKNEKRDFKTLLSQHILDEHQLTFLRSQIYAMANEHINANNYSFILEWIKTGISALTIPAPSTADAFFSPGDACRNVIIQQISSANSHLQICVFTISDDSITKSLLAAHQKGVHIKIITDNDKSLDVGSDIEQLAKAGIFVRMDTTPNHMHHKFMVADKGALITGSYNWTLSAARYNHENILITREPGIIKTFSRQFEQLWEVMEPYS
jgi:phosphatidylserine/phosphatidylglycerophosphate/cardiolipin synthase-like enzyme